MSGKGTGEMAVITSTMNAQVSVEIADAFLIPSIERMFGEDYLIFQVELSFRQDMHPVQQL